MNDHELWKLVTESADRINDAREAFNATCLEKFKYPDKDRISVEHRAFALTCLQKFIKHQT